MVIFQVRVSRDFRLKFIFDFIDISKGEKWTEEENHTRGKKKNNKKIKKSACATTCLFLPYLVYGDDLHSLGNMQRASYSVLHDVVTSWMNYAWEASVFCRTSRGSESRCSINSQKYDKSGLSFLVRAVSVDVVKSLSLRTSGWTVAGIKHSCWRLPLRPRRSWSCKYVSLPKNPLISALQIEARLSRVLFLLFLMLTVKPPRSQLSKETLHQFKMTAYWNLDILIRSEQCICNPVQMLVHTKAWPNSKNVIW